LNPQACCRGQGQVPPRDGPLWHKYYFELKAIKTQQIQESSLSPPQMPACTRKRAISRDPSLPKKLIYTIEQPLFSKHLISLSDNGLSLLCIFRPLPLSLAQISICCLTVFGISMFVWILHIYAIKFYFLLLICLMST